MKFKSAPRVNTRYWTAISLASMCGTNLGDVFKDVFGLGPGPELSILAGAFVTILLVDRLAARAIEALYWMAILTVRAAATAIADYSIDIGHLSYLEVGGALAAILAGLVILNTVGKSSKTGYPSATGLYWVAMLSAGTLGTIMGDGLGHAFGSPIIGVPVSAVLSTLALLIIFGLRGKTGRTLGVTYWIAIVGFRWWGTNTGDIFAHLATLTSSMAITGAAMTLVLLFWSKQQVEERPTMDLARE